MFGDIGHGLMMLLFACVLIIFEKKLAKTKEGGEVGINWSIFVLCASIHCVFFHMHMHTYMCSFCRLSSLVATCCCSWGCSPSTLASSTTRCTPGPPISLARVGGHTTMDRRTSPLPPTPVPRMLPLALHLCECTHSVV